MKKLLILTVVVALLANCRTTEKKEKGQTNSYPNINKKYLKHTSKILYLPKYKVSLDMNLKNSPELKEVIEKEETTKEFLKFIKSNVIDHTQTHLAKRNEFWQSILMKEIKSKIWLSEDKDKRVGNVEGWNNINNMFKDAGVNISSMKPLYKYDVELDINLKSTAKLKEVIEKQEPTKELIRVLKVVLLTENSTYYKFAEAYQNFLIKQIEGKKEGFVQAMKIYRGDGCHIPEMKPFDKYYIKLDMKLKTTAKLKTVIEKQKPTDKFIRFLVTVLPRNTLGFGKYKEAYQEFLMQQIEDKNWVTQ